jgi:2-deoxy-D-gluconate 3-dehydrogenase
MSTPFDLAGKTAAVTGGGRGLGLGISTALLQAGADVIVFGRAGIPVELTARAESLGRQVRFVALDLADSDAIAAAAQRVLSAHRVDILVNNAGTQDRYPAADFPLQAWDRVLNINLRAVFQLCQLFGRPMLERGEGKIVNLASLLSFQGGLTVTAYAASKGAVAQLTKEWAGRGVNVNAVAPGYMATEMNTALLADPERMEQLGARIPAGRWGQPQDIGNVVVFLSSPAAAYIHGQVLAVDGGWMAR